MKKFKPNFYWYIRKHPGYIIGLIPPLCGAISGIVKPQLLLLGATCSLLLGMMISAISKGYKDWKKGVLTQYDKEGNDITTTDKKNG